MLPTGRGGAHLLEKEWDDSIRPLAASLRWAATAYPCM